jgi:putative flavoprotein involved in K+ transport
MHTFKSGLLSGVGADAEFLADQMARGSVPDGSWAG